MLTMAKGIRCFGLLILVYLGDILTMHKLYSQYASPQRQLMDRKIPSVLEIIDKIPAYPEGRFAIGDYGTADGGNSLLLLDKIIECVKKKRGDDYEISIIYEDQLANDFNTLFRKLKEKIVLPTQFRVQQTRLSSKGWPASGFAWYLPDVEPAPDQPNFIQKYKNIYASATSTNFFMQCVPKSTLNLVLCFSSAHWIPRSSIPTGCPRRNLLPVGSDIVKEVAAKCWRDFLHSRSEELIPGGYVFVGLPCRREKMMSTTEVEPYGYFSALEDSWLSLFKEGIITKEEQRRLFLPLYLRTEQEIRAPFNDRIKDSNGKMNIKLVSMQTENVPFSFHENETGEIGEKKTVANKFCEFMKSFTIGSVFPSLSNLRNHNDKKKIADRLYQLLHDYHVSHPEKCVIYHMYASIILKKEL